MSAKLDGVILGVDWNSTLQDQISEIIRQARIIYGVELALDDFNQWDAPLGAKCGVTDQQFTRWAWTSPEIQREAQPYPGVADSLSALSQLGVRIHVITSTSNPGLVVPWLDYHGIPFDKVVFSNDKSVEDFDVLVDDSPTTLARVTQAGRRAIRHAIPWNQHMATFPALTHWLRLPSLLATIL